MREEIRNTNIIETHSLKDYIDLMRRNLLPVILIITVAFITSVIYAINATDIYKSTASLKIMKSQGNILYSPVIPEFQDFGNDRFLANEIEILKTYSTRERVAESLIETFNRVGVKDSFYILLDVSSAFQETQVRLHSVENIAKRLSSAVSIDQKRGLDILEISVESPSAYEAALIANTYASEYKTLNLEVNRNQLSIVKNFLLEQKKEKQAQLNDAEETLRKFQEKGRVIALDEQANNLISQLSNFEAQKNAAQIELMASNKILSQYNRELDKQNPRLADYLKSLSSEAYFKSLQEQLIKLEVNRDIALLNRNPVDNKNKLVDEYEQKIKDLKNKLNSKIEEIKDGIFASSPAEVKELSQKMIEEEVRNQALEISVSELESIVISYEDKFNRLPKTAIELARYQRGRESLEKLYTLVEEKYQEALINEQSQPGNVFIIDDARKPSNPSKPNRFLILMVGLILGAGLAFGYVLVKNYFDNTIKTPDDIQNRNIAILGWVPKFDITGTNGTGANEFIVAQKPDSIAGEAFRTIRTRIKLSKLDANSLKTILVTSPAPQEGKTIVGINLGGSFAQANRRTLIIDCDLRKPRVHVIFKNNRIPGLIDYLFGQVQLANIINKTEVDNLHYISCGTIPPNPAEMLESEKMKEFLFEMRERYDIVLLDSPPIIAVTDSEILSTMVDGTILVVSADTTEFELLDRSVELIKNDKSSFIGTILNNFSYKNGYGSYYKYYSYSKNSPGEKNKPKV